LPVEIIYRVDLSNITCIHSYVFLT